MKRKRNMEVPETKVDFFVFLPLELQAEVVSYLLECDVYVFPNLCAVNKGYETMFTKGVLGKMINDKRQRVKTLRQKIQSLVFPKEKKCLELKDADHSCFFFLYTKKNQVLQSWAKYIHPSSLVITDETYLARFYSIRECVYISYGQRGESIYRDFKELSAMDRFGRSWEDAIIQHNEEVTFTLWSFLERAYTGLCWKDSDQKSNQGDGISDCIFGTAFIFFPLGTDSYSWDMIHLAERNLSFAPGTTEEMTETFGKWAEYHKNKYGFNFKSVPNEERLMTIKNRIQQKAFAYYQKLIPYKLHTDCKPIMDLMRAFNYIYMIVETVNVQIWDPTVPLHLTSSNIIGYLWHALQPSYLIQIEYRKFITAILIFECNALPSEDYLSPSSSCIEICSTCFYSFFNLSPYRYAVDKTWTFFPSPKRVEDTKTYVRQNYSKKVQDQFLQKIFGTTE